MLPFLRSLQLRLATLRRRELLDQDLQDELAFHMAMRAEKLAEQGVDTSDAPATAQRRFGNATTIRENLRAQWSFPAIESWWQDLRHAARALRRTPGFTAVAVLSLAMGIGGNTAVFSTLHALYLRSLPVGNPEELRIPTWAAKGRTPADSISGYRTQYNALVVNGSFSWDVYTGIALAPPFQSVAGWANYQTNISHRGDAFVAPAHLITSNYFDTLRVQLVAGRSFLPEENTAGGQPVVLISARLARRLFGTEAAALGSAVNIERTPHTIAGVTPETLGGMSPGDRVDVYLPIGRAAELTRWYTFNPNNWWVQAIARLAPGQDDTTAKAALDLILARAVQTDAVRTKATYGVMSAVLVSGRSGLSFLERDRAEFLYALIGMAGLVLLIACSNVANLLLARGAVRGRELAVRQSLGAGRGRVIRHLVLESALIACAGGSLGFVLAHAGSIFFEQALFSNPEARMDLSPDSTVLMFTAVLSFGTALLFGLMPAWRASGVRPAAALRNAGAAPGAPGQWLARTLVAAQVTAATVLVTGAGLFGQTMRNLSNVELGFRKEGILLFEVDASRNGYKDKKLIDVYRRLEERFRTIPGALQVSHSGNALIGGGAINTTFTVINSPGEVDGRKEPLANIHVSGTGFLTVTGTPILMGRDIAEADTESAPRVAVINRALADRYIAGDPIGRELTFGGAGEKPYRIVGVAGNAKYESIREQHPIPTIYLPYAQASYLGRRYFAIRTAGDPAQLAPAVRQALASIDPTLPASDFRTQDEQIRRALAREHTFAILAWVFSAASLLLACIGLYGVFAYAVTRRIPEFGVRMALGANGSHVRWLVLRGALVVLAAGLLAGIPAALGCSRFVRTLLFGVEPADLTATGMAIATLVATGLVAAWLPARRASMSDPASALRAD